MTHWTWQDLTLALTVSPRLHQNAKESDPGHLSNLFYILCGHFDGEKSGIPLTRGKGKPSKSEGTGWLPLWKKKYLHDMDLKLTEHVRNTISLELYKQKPR